MDAVTRIHIELGTGDSGRIAVWVGDQEAVSMFFDARSIDRAYAVVNIVRPLLARRRRANRRGPGIDSGDQPATRRSGRETTR